MSATIHQIILIEKIADQPDWTIPGRTPRGGAEVGGPDRGLAHVSERLEWCWIHRDDGARRGRAWEFPE